jgi:transcriptional regulator with XRE-family HTH domain
MDQPPVSGSPGAKLKELRKRLHLTLRDVEARSREIAADKKNPDYIISRGWLNNVENKSFTPSIYKINALEIIYHTPWTNIVSFFGLTLSDFVRDQARYGLPTTQLISQTEVDETKSIVIPMGSASNLKLDKTNLLSRLVEIWGEVPFRLIQHLDARKAIYGVIGLSDYTMWPLIRPGSIVQIDGNERKLLPIKWENEHERPIYFVELRDQYFCSWCEIREGHLLVVPYPNSRCEIRRFPYPREADIIGRVTGVAMRLVEAHP